jgi:heme a synthase
MMFRAALIRPLAITAFLLCLVVVVLGAYVRLSAAGLSCPDWPGCYGHFSPAGSATDANAAAIDVGKAWKEMIHRYSAATLGVLIISITALAIQYKRERIIAPAYAVALLALVVTQGIFGMLTVTRQLEPAIVTTHLLFGLTTLALLWWLVLTIARQQSTAWRGSTPFLGSSLPRTRRLAWLGLAALAVQLALGGWTSSHYAATACPDFPTCQGQWWPAMTGPVGIHFAHRLGALCTSALLLLAVVRVLRSRSDNFARRAALAVLVALIMQLLIGVSMVLRGFPLWLATAHNAGAAVLLLAVVALVRSLRPTWRPA